MLPFTFDFELGHACLPVRDGVDGDLVALVVELVDHGVVGVLVGDVEGGVDGAAVGVLLALRCNSIHI